jgi:polyisoprenoid-binding protein YceI
LTAARIEHLILKITFKLLFCIIVPVFAQDGLNTASASEPGSGADENSINQNDLLAVYSKLEKSDGRVFTLSPKLSSIRIYAFRGGAAPGLGHNHVLTSPNFTGFIYLPDKGLSNARFDLEFRLDQLEIDNPDARANLGEAFEPTPTLDAIKRTRDHMLGEDNLQENQFPFVRIHSVHVAGEAPKFAVEVQVELHGQQQKMSIPISVEGLPNHITATGAFVIRQSDFGIKPYSVLGGFLAVQNEVVIEFSLSDTYSPL